MKRAIFLLLFAMSVALTAASCGGGLNADFRVAIVQQMDHASLDEIRAAIETSLESAAEEHGIHIHCQTYSGQNDPSILSQIGAQVMAGGYNLILPIGTLAAQYMVTASHGEVPVVYAAVSDPETAGLTGLTYVTGISDALDTEFILQMMLALDPDIQTVGLLYSNSEVNSARPIAQARAWLEERGIRCLEKTGSTTDEILAAAGSLAGRVDAVFTPTDNVVMGAEAAVARLLTAAGIPHYTGADAFAHAGAFAACGVSYTALGEEAARMAVEVLLGGQVPEYRTMPGGIITVNTDTAALLGLDIAPLYGMADTVVTVTTGQ